MQKLDKKLLAPGPWHDEPDRVDFVHEGFACFINRAPLGVWCGYVGVPEGHPWFGKQYDNISADVHGGLTYSALCHGELCHVPQPGMPDHVWWLGFDCGHYMDLVPKMITLEATVLKDLPRTHHGIYKDQHYVTRETQRLAEQARAVALDITKSSEKTAGAPTSSAETPVS